MLRINPRSQDDLGEQGRVTDSEGYDYLVLPCFLELAYMNTLPTKVEKRNVKQRVIIIQSTRRNL